MYSGDAKSSEPTLVKGYGDGTVNLKSLKGCERWVGVTSKEFPGVTHMEMVTGEEVTDYVANLVSAINLGQVTK